MSLEVRVSLLILVGMLGLGSVIYVFASASARGLNVPLVPELSTCAECRVACARENMRVHSCETTGYHCHCTETP